MKNNLLTIVILLIGLVLFGIWMYFSGAARTPATRATVSGEAETEVKPDTAVITLSVVTFKKEALDAQQTNAAKSTAVREAIEAVLAGSKADFKTSNYTLQPQQDFYSGKAPVIMGYNVRNTIAVSTTNLDSVGSVIDAGTKAGANSVEGVNYVIGETNPAQGDALERATKQAMTKAESVARSLNGRVVRVVETIEGGIPVLPNADLRMAGLSNAAMETKAIVNTPIDAGKSKIYSRVVLVVEIGS